MRSGEYQYDSIADHHRIATHNTTPMIVELLTAAPWHDSAGDMALAEATAAQLARRGVATIPVSRATGERPCVIGGGAILTGARKGLWWHALEPFHAPGQHVLNAVTVVSGGDFSHLKDYRYVTTRDEASRQRLLKARPDTVCVPCCTALLDAPNLDYLRKLPNWKWLDVLLAQEYTLVDIEVAQKVKVPGKTVTVGTRAWCQRGKAELTPSRTDALLAAISGARAVIAGSLHLSILAVAMGKPTVFVRNASAWKGESYWGRAGFLEIMYSGDDPLGYAESILERVGQVNQQDRELAATHLDRIAEVLRGCD